MKSIILLLATLVGFANPATAAIALDKGQDPVSRWGFEYGVSFITSNNIQQISEGDITIASGPAGGKVHHFTTTYRLADPDWQFFGRTFTPSLELPLTLQLVDERGRSPFLDYNASFQIRWRDFPWSRLIPTTFATGVGLSYSEKVYLMDIQRHPNRQRSHLKFNWPIQMTLAHPRHPKHQLTLFIAHHSGGHIFDRGGVNSLGFGYRWGF